MIKTTTARLGLLTSLAALPLSFGCAAGGATDPETGAADDGATASPEVIGTTKQALNLGRGFWYWYDNHNSAGDLGDAANQTCWLAGMGGDFGGGVSPEETLYYAEAGAFLAADRYWIRAHGNVKKGLSVGGYVKSKVMCVGSALNRYRRSWDAGDPRKTLKPVAPNRHCFIESIHGGTRAFQTNTDRIVVANDGVNWYIEGYVDPTGFGDEGQGATAVCFDAPPGGGVGQWNDFYLDGTNDSITWHLMNESSAAACGLTQIRGRFTGTYDGDDGVHILWPSASPGAWRIKIENGPNSGSRYHRGSVRCIE